MQEALRPCTFRAETESVDTCGRHDMHLVHVSLLGTFRGENRLIRTTQPASAINQPYDECSDQ